MKRNNLLLNILFTLLFLMGCSSIENNNKILPYKFADQEKDDKDYYFVEESDDYWMIFGENTKYMVDPVECMSDNFGYALVYGNNGQRNYKNPEIIQGIIEQIKG